MTREAMQKEKARADARAAAWRMKDGKLAGLYPQYYRLYRKVAGNAAR